MTKGIDDGSMESPVGFDRFEEIGVERIAEGEEVLLVMGPKESGKTNLIHALLPKSGSGRQSRHSTPQAVRNATHAITEIYRLHSEHLPKIDADTGDERQIKSLVILECSSEYYDGNDNLGSLLDSMRSKNCRVAVLMCGNIISGSTRPSQDLVNRLRERKDLRNLTLVETHWDRVTVWKRWTDSAYHENLIQGAWKDLVEFTHTSVAQFNNEKSPALDAWRIVFNTLRTDLNGGDIVILIMGPTGTGKSSFIRSATGRLDVKVGNGLESETQRITAWAARKPEDGRRVVYIDTPGFDDTYTPDSTLLEKIASWLHHNLTNNIPISGILYFHSIDEVRMSGTAVRNLQVFQKLCGFYNSDFARRIFFITTMWDQVSSSEEGERRLEELCNKWWAPMIKKGAQQRGLRQPKGAPTTKVIKDVAEHVINSTSQTASPIQSKIGGAVKSGDIVILTIGSVGAGKSTFIRTAADQPDVKPGTTLKPETNNITAWTAKKTQSGRRVVYIDTPGFDNIGTSDSETITDLAAWISDKHSNVPISAILYFHRISDNKAGANETNPFKANLELLQRRCRSVGNSDFASRVFFITTMWDRINPTEGDRRLKELCDTLWKEMLDGGAQERALRPGGDDAKKLEASGPLNIDCVQDVVRAVVSSVFHSSSHYLHSSRTTIQDELQEGKDALDTAAARVLYKNAEKQRKDLKRLIDKLEAEKGAIVGDGFLKTSLEKDLEEARKEFKKVKDEEALLRKGAASSFKVVPALGRVLDKVRGRD